MTEKIWQWTTGEEKDHNPEDLESVYEGKEVFATSPGQAAIKVFKSYFQGQDSVDITVRELKDYSVGPSESFNVYIALTRKDELR